MTSVNISTTKNTVEVINATTNVIEVSTTGPQGPAFAIDLNHVDKVNNSIMYYEASSDTLKLDNTVTVEKLVDGGNFWFLNYG